jgi:hypothetical protein
LRRMSANKSCRACLAISSPLRYQIKVTKLGEAGQAWLITCAAFL